jgi:AraC-like DNA-binding protein
MRFQFRVPDPPLREFVSLLWDWHDVTKPHAMERLMPNGETALIVNLKDDLIRIYDKDSLALSQTTRGCILVGPHSQPAVIDCEEQECVFGIQFRAGGSFPFFGMPADESTNQQIALEDVWGREDGYSFRDELLAARTSQARFDVAEQYLMARLGVRGAHPAVAFAIREISCQPSDRRIADITEATGLSARRFIQLFREQVGLTPKTFCRVRRFQHVIASLHQQKQVDWTEVALGCGYYDQSHFIHDFRGFAGVSPSMYLANATEHMNHVPVGAD